jgi:hypothetical protein
LARSRLRANLMGRGGKLGVVVAIAIAIAVAIGLFR